MKDNILLAINEANAAYVAHLVAKDRMAEQLTNLMRKLVRPGDLINTNYEKDKSWVGREWLVGVRVIRGNDRGTRLFRVESEVVVDANTHHFSGSRWTCEATPVSEKTGKDMSGRSHGADGNRGTVKIACDLIPFGNVMLHKEEGAYEKFLMDSLLHMIKVAESKDEQASKPRIAP